MTSRRWRRKQHRRSRTPLGRAVAVIALIAVLAFLVDRSGLDRLVDGALWTGSTSDTVTRSTIPEGERFDGRVTRIVDGDTLWISGQDVRIRIWGLDAPEANEPGGSTATTALTRLVSGRDLTCRQRDIDRYGRIVGQCFLPDGRDITAVMIENGTATEYCFFSGNHYGTC